MKIKKEIISYFNMAKMNEYDYYQYVKTQANEILVKYKNNLYVGNGDYNNYEMFNDSHNMINFHIRDCSAAMRKDVEHRLLIDPEIEEYSNINMNGLFPTKYGFYNPRTKLVDAYHPGSYAFVKSPVEIVEYNDELKNKVDNMISTAVGKDNLNRFYEQVAYIFFDKTKFLKKLFIGIGKAADNGKSSILNIIKFTLGPLAMAVKSHKLGEQFYLEGKDEAFLLFEDDSQTKACIDDETESQIKNIISDQTVDIPQKYKKSLQTEMPAKFIFASNNTVMPSQMIKSGFKKVEVIDFQKDFDAHPELKINDMHSFVRSNAVHSYLIQRAGEAYLTLIERGTFEETPAARIDKCSYIMDCQIGRGMIYARDNYLNVNDYSQYMMYVNDTHEHEFSKAHFTAILRDISNEHDRLISGKDFLL